MTGLATTPTTLAATHWYNVEWILDKYLLEGKGRKKMELLSPDTDSSSNTFWTGLKENSSWP